MPDKINNYLKSTTQQQIDDIGQMTRVILESLAVKYAQVLENIERVSGVTIEKIHIVGGGSQNTLLNQFAADATSKQVIAGPVEATVLGNILVQAVADKAITDIHQGRKLIADTFDLKKYSPKNTDQWQQFRTKAQKITRTSSQ
jgi:sugar (pentulose or hexulose) kinase